MNAHQKMVREFHQAKGLTYHGEPCFLSIEDRILRYKLHLEESLEFINADISSDINKCADALGDLLYVVYGTAVSMGIDMEPVMKEIHRSNMTKSNEKNEYGKIIKGRDFSPVDPEMFWVN